VSPIVELEDISIRQLQHIRSEYLSSLDLVGRTDRMNCYIWDGSAWAGAICGDYYNMHIRPLFIIVSGDAGHRGAQSWLTGVRRGLAQGDRRGSLQGPGPLG